VGKTFSIDQSGEDHMYRRIVVALDGSELAERVLPHAEVLADRFEAQLILVRATPAAGIPADALDADRREADHYLTGLSTSLTAKGLSVHYQRLEGSPTELIAEHARTQDADLIALTSHGHGGLQGPSFGHVAEAVILTAPCSLLIVRVDRAR
jgi:nucleotide-binding universal stress UspA family protein